MVTCQPSPRFDIVPGSVSLGEFAIIYFGNDWFAENRTSSHHIAERLSERTRVLYVDSPGLRAPKANRRDLRKLCRKLLSVARRPQCAGERLWQMSVPQIPFRRLPFVRRVNIALGKFLVKRALKRLGFARTVSWFAVPHPGFLANAFDEAAVVYYCIDDYAALPDVDSRAVAEMDAHLTSRADQVFVASRLMLRAKQRLRPSTVLAPHGVDVALFRTASDPRLPIATDARNLRRPVVGFYGLIEEWIDLDLIADLAERRPRWTFLMIGRLAVDPGRLKAMPNVVFAGPQPYRSLPNWLKAFDVAIIPYRLTRQVVNSAPLKLREYLASGKPVVAVPAPEIERFAGLVRIARGPEQFIREIEAALFSDPDADRARRIEATSDMTWDARISEIVEIVEHRIWQKEYIR
ncbi:MAG TPA: glycosyltransferase [Vicinamibacterales bacterium]|jgi:glycosyltransferase involved in cell wall biosynthesis|nr:glycosyltransferase [Vicinamibacterales bacterium]